MNEERVLKSEALPATAENFGTRLREEGSARISSGVRGKSKAFDRSFHYVWLVVNGLLIVSIVFMIYAVGWEFSTRRYLKGFSDAIVPATAPGDEKIEAILRWMQHGPARLPYGPSAMVPDRDPTDTLNYDALLQVCGTATNAFINLANTGRLEVRRLLLLDQNQMTKHVVAEVMVDGRWIIVDPAYRAVLRDDAGRTVTRQDLLNPVTFAAVIRQIPNFSPTYTFDHTVHIRVARLHVLGMPLRVILNRVAPGWEDSMAMTLLVERESFAAMVLSFLLVTFFLLLRYTIRWFAEAQLGIPVVRLRSKVYRAGAAFWNPAN
jgi:hypothetical protein